MSIANPTQQQIQMMQEAGELILAVVAIHEQCRLADHEGQPSPVSDRTLSGLMVGLNMSGDLLWTEGSELGRFMMTVGALYQQRLKSPENSEAHPITCQTLDGLMPGLQAAADKFLSAAQLCAKQ